jgi:hypothetical protein
MGKEKVDPKKLFKGKIPKRNPVLEPHDSTVGKRVCVACLMLSAGRGSGLIKPPHSYVEGICRFKAPGVVRYAPGEEAYLAEQKRLDKHVPF